MATRKELEQYLDWLVSPQDEIEQQIFKENPDFVDKMCRIKNRLDSMSDEQLINEINIELAPYGVQIDPAYEPPSKRN